MSVQSYPSQRPVAVLSEDMPRTVPFGPLQVARASQGALVSVAALPGGQGPCREDDDPEAGRGAQSSARCTRTWMNLISRSCGVALS